jgi:hypothetical protein
MYITPMKKSSCDVLERHYTGNIVMQTPEDVWNEQMKHGG